MIIRKMIIITADDSRYAPKTDFVLNTVPTKGTPDHGDIWVRLTNHIISGTS